MSMTKKIENVQGRTQTEVPVWEFPGKRVFATSDTHFNHDNVIAYSKRPYASVGAMNEALIANWNAVVQPGDVVLHMGDVAMGDKTLLPKILSRLNGDIYLVAGNHDNKRYDSLYKEAHWGGPVLLCHNGIYIEMLHRPHRLLGLGSLAFCGHVHNQWRAVKQGDRINAYVAGHRVDDATTAQRLVINVGVDVQGYTPVLVDTLLEESDVR